MSQVNVFKFVKIKWINQDSAKIHELPNILTHDHEFGMIHPTLVIAYTRKL